MRLFIPLRIPVPSIEAMQNILRYDSVNREEGMENGAIEQVVEEWAKSNTARRSRCNRWYPCAALGASFLIGIIVGKWSSWRQNIGLKQNPEPLEAFVNVTVDPTHLVNEASGSDHGFACVTLDFWPETKCDYGRCSWKNASVLTLPLSGAPETNASQRLRKALEALSKIHVEGSTYSFALGAPAILRLGGSTADLIRYDIYDDNSTSPWNCTDFVVDNTEPIGYKNDPYAGPCLSMQRWGEIESLCREGNCQLVYGINALFGRTKVSCPEGTSCSGDKAKYPTPGCCHGYTGEWNSSNAEAFFNHTKTKGLKVWGFEFGNELAGKSGVQARLSVDEYIQGFCDLKAVIDKTWDTSDETRPRLLAPESGFDHRVQDWYAEFLMKSEKAGCMPDVITWHQYLLGAGVDPAVGERSMDPQVLDTQKRQAETIMSTIQSTDAEHIPELWMGEGGGAYNSGRHGVTDTFHSSFWFLDSLGALAARGHQAFCRQTLVGGNYGLLDSQSFEPNPDYYALLLFQKLMGAKVLQVFEPGESSTSNLRFYAHCSRRADTDGSITILLTNLSSVSHFHVNMRSLLSTDYVDFRALEHTSWVIGAETLDSKSVSLNGEENLKTSADGDIPALTGSFSHGLDTPYFTIQPHTFAFLRFDSEDAITVCQRNSL